MIAAVTEAAGAMRVRDVPEPRQPRAGEVLVRPTAVGICGSDFHFFEGLLSEQAENGPLGMPDASPGEDLRVGGERHGGHRAPSRRTT